MQRENIKGAIAYHAGFPPDEVIPDENVCFQDGKVVEVPVSEIDPEKGIVWCEVSSKGVLSYDIVAD
jgi:hypothetical protein